MYDNWELLLRQCLTKASQNQYLKKSSRLFGCKQLLLLMMWVSAQGGMDWEGAAKQIKKNN